MTNRAKGKPFPGPPEPDLPEPPEHLSETMQEWWRSVVEVFVLQPHHLQLLRRACESWDVAEQARELLDAEGPTTVDRFGQVKPHPAAGVWRDNVGSFQRLVRELGLDKLAGDSRPPRLY